MYEWPDLTFPPLNLWNYPNHIMHRPYHWALGAFYPTDEEIMNQPPLPTNEAPHSSHYKNLVPEPIDVIESWNLGFNLGNVVKYVARAPYKGTPKQDLEKAMFYLKHELEKY